MKNPLFWNDAELRLRAGWRILIQVLMISAPLAIFGLFGLYSSGDLAIKMPMAGILAKSIGLILILLWIKKSEGKIETQKNLASPTLL